MPLLNLYDLFEDVTRSVLHVDQFDSALEGQINDAYKYLCNAFHDSKPVDYSDALVRAAYMLAFAPRYAIFWQKFYSLAEFKFGYTRLRTPQSGVLKLNFIGAGPGSEIAGIAAAGIPTHVRTDVNIIDIQTGWIDCLEACLTSIESVSGVKSPLFFHYPSLENLEVNWPVIGSFVLSDLARQGILDSYLNELASLAKGQPAMFMDTYDFRDADGNPRHLEDFFGIKPDWTVNLHVDCNLGDAIHKQYVACPRLSCQKPNVVPKIAVYKFRF